MKIETLDFEEPIALLLKEIEALRLLSHTPERHKEIKSIQQRIDSVRREIYSRLTPWQQVLVARHPNRPNTLDYVERLFSDFTELHGDRRFSDDPAIVTGFAKFGDDQILVVGHQKGRGTREKIQRNFGYTRPEGFRKALRTMKFAQKFNRPIIIFIDTPAAYPGIESEERGVAEAIALNLREMALLEVPIIVMVTGEGGSGGALGIAIGDSVLIQEHAIYSVIPPEGCAAILWRDAGKKIEAAEALKIKGSDLLKMEIVDEIIPEPNGGAHTDMNLAADLLAKPLRIALEKNLKLSVSERLEYRYEKFRRMGNIGIETIKFSETVSDNKFNNGTISTQESKD